MGIQYGITQNIFVSLIAEKVPEDLRNRLWMLLYYQCYIGTRL